MTFASRPHVVALAALVTIMAGSGLAGPATAPGGGSAAPAGGPAVSEFVLPGQAAKLTFPVKLLAATGDAVGYLITKTPIPPAATQPGWSASPPKSITETEPGVYDYYAWAADSQGRVSRSAAQTVDVATTKITVGPKGRDFADFKAAIAGVAARGSPKGVVIEADAGEYPSWRKDGGFPEDNPTNIIKVAADSLTIRGVGGRAHLAYKCRGATSKDRWTIPPGGTQHGAVIVQAARNLRLENVEISGGCNANTMNGAGLWVEPSGIGTVLKNCFFHDNDNGLLTSHSPDARVVILNSEFFMNGAPGPADEGQNHNIYVGQIDELIFMFNWSHASFRGQLLKSRAGRNYVLYNRLTDEKDSNILIDLPFGGESYVIGNLVQLSPTNRSQTIISYAREVVMDITYENGGPEPLLDRAVLTNERTGKKSQLHYSLNYGARGMWANRDRANHCTLSITQADGPDFRPGDRLTYGQNSSIEVVSADWSWSGPRRELYVCSNTIINECAVGYGQYVLRAHPDTAVALVKNNLMIDLKPPRNPYRLLPDASKGTKEKRVTEENNLWRLNDPGLLADLDKYDYTLLPSATAAIDKAAPPGSVNGMSLAPVYQYVHPCSSEPRPVVGGLDLGAYECPSAATQPATKADARPQTAPQKTERRGPLAGLPSKPGPHIAKIKALGDDQWLDLGAPAPDPKWGGGRGRSWCAQLDYAPDLRGAFHSGEGVHSFVKPDGHYMDDFFFYDINAHAWICVYPGAKAGDDQGLKINEQGFFADDAGDIFPVTPLSAHNYGMTAYDSDRGKLVIAPTEKVITLWGVIKLKQIEKLAPEAAAKLKGKVFSPWFLNVATGKFEREPAQCTTPKDLPLTMGALAIYLPSIKKVFFRDKNWSTLSGNNWLYDPHKKTWSRAADGPAKNIGGGGVLCYDSKRDRIYLPTAKTWYAYDVEADKWTDLSPKGGGRALDPNNDMVTYDSANDVVVVISYRAKDKSGMYIYDPAANAWLNDTPKLPPAGWAGDWPSLSAFYDPVNNVHYYYRASDSGDANLKFWVYRYKRSAASATPGPAGADAPAPSAPGGNASVLLAVAPLPSPVTQPERKPAATTQPIAIQGETKPAVPRSGVYSPAPTTKFAPLPPPATTQAPFRMNPRLTTLPDNTWLKMNPKYVYHPDQIAALEKIGRKPSGFCHFKGEASLCYDSSVNQTIYFGGCTSGYGNNLWVYDCSNDTWTQISPDVFTLRDDSAWRFREDPKSVPPGCCYYGMCYDPDRKVSVLCRPNGGATSWVPPEQPPNNLAWLYDALAHKWLFTEHNGVTPDVYITGVRWDYDPGRKECVLAGGGALWAYKTSENAWRKINVQGVSAKPGNASSWAYMSQEKKFLLLKALKKTDPAGETTWFYDPKEQTWENVAPKDAPPNRQSAAMCYDSTNNVAIMLAGWEEAPSKKFNDGTWVFDPREKTWTQMKLSPSPPIGGNCYQMSYDAVNNVAVYVTGGPAAETWVYRYKNPKH